MLKSTIKKFTVVFSSLATLLIFCQTANANPKGLDIGAPTKIPPGQESQFLQYQLQNNEAGLRQMRVMPRCVVGEGLGCGKTVTVLEQIIQSNGGLTYQQMVTKAAGGQTNYRNFAAYYDNNPNLPQVPKSSFWRHSSPLILDSYQYTLGGTLSRSPVSGLGGVTKNFAWSPLQGEDLRSGLLNFKYATGYVLLQEAAKIPNLNQQIRELNLEPSVTQFYLNNLSRGLNALQTGNETELKQSILTLLSRPYAPNATDDGWYGRQLVQLPGVIQPGETLTADAFTDLAIEPISNESILEIADLPGEEVLLPASDGGFGFLPILGGLGLLAALLLLLGGEDDSSSNAVARSIPEPTVTPTPRPTPEIPDYSCPPGTIQVDNPGSGGQPQCITPPTTAKVVEPSLLKAIILVTLFYCLIAYQKKRRHKLTSIV